MHWFKRGIISIIVFFIALSFLSGLSVVAQQEYLAKYQEYSFIGHQFKVSFNTGKSLLVQGLDVFPDWAQQMTLIVYERDSNVKLNEHAIVVNDKKEINLTIDLSYLKDGLYFFYVQPNMMYFSDLFYFRIKNNQGYLVLNEAQDINRRYLNFVSSYNPDFYTSTTGLATSEQAKEMNNFAKTLTKSATTNSQKVRIIHDWITHNIYYDFVCYTQCDQSAYAVFKRRTAVCAGYSRLFTFLLRSLNIPTLYVRGLADNGVNPGMHAWNLVYLEGKWRIFDTTWNTGLSYNESNGFYQRFPPQWKYYDVSSDYISKSHIFEFNPLPPSNLKVTSSKHGQVTISWNKDLYVDEYSVDYMLDPSSRWYRPIGAYLNSDQTKITVSIDLEYNTKYYFRFKSFKQTIDGELSSDSSFFEFFTQRFSDVPYGHQTYTRINDLAEKGIINGYQDNTFRPNNNITRAQAAVMIVRALGIDQKGKTSSFADVPSSHASYEFISAAYEAGIISGYSADNTFRPNDKITRQQIAVMIQRAFNVVHSGDNISFSDVPDSIPSKRFIEALASNGIINGYSDGTFKPTNDTTRAQFSSMIYNAMRYGN